MLTSEQIDDLILAGSYHNAAGGIYATSVYDFANDVQMLAAAAARAEVEPLVRQMLELKSQFEAHLIGVMEDRIIGDKDHAGRLIARQYDAAEQRLRAWLNPQVGDKGDAS